ncbi:MAG: METTL5 family protein [Candidatus Woesearchaeota archaeon]
MLSKSTLGILLSKLADFERPDTVLEQYTTPSEIAAEVLWHAYISGFIEGKTVADIGCGTGILGIGALLLDAEKVYFLDIDKKVFETAKQNLDFIKENYSLDFSGKAEFIHADASMFSTKVDLLLQNPPFGTKQKHADTEFLEYASRNSGIIYSFHKLETADFIEKKIAKLGFKTFSFFKFNMQLKKTMPQHIKRIEKIPVGCWAIKRV